MKNASLIFVLMTIFAVCAYSQNDKPKPDAKQAVTVTGEIVDLKCLLPAVMSGSGENHNQCDSVAVLAILEDSTGNVYPVVPLKEIDGDNITLLRYVAQEVVLTGTFMDKGGIREFFYTTVEGKD
jgi:hypothetical protein